MSPQNGRETRNIVHLRPGRHRSLFRAGHRNATMPTWAAVGDRQIQVGIHVLWRVRDCSAGLLWALKVAMQLQKLSKVCMRPVRLSLPKWSCLPAHVTYTCSSTLGIAVHSHQLPPIPSASPTLMHFTLSIAAQRLNEYRMAAERVPSITHTPSFDSDALYYAERTIQSISGQCSGGRSFAFANAFAEDCST